MKKKLIASLSLVAVLIVGFIVLNSNIFNTYEISISVSTLNYTNQSVILTATKIEDALYSFNNLEFTNDNTYEVLENTDSIPVKIKLPNNKIINKSISITNIDKNVPKIIELYTNYNSTKENVFFEIIAEDMESGILEYIYIIDDQEYKTSEKKFTVPVVKDNIVLKIVDKAGNELIIDEIYYKKIAGEINVAKNISDLTNKNVTLTILKEKGYQEYSFSYDNIDNYTSSNTFDVNQNGTIFIKVKTLDKVLTKQIIIDNIDKEKPTLKYDKIVTSNSITITLIGTDNSDELLYQFGSEPYGSNNEKIFLNNLINYSIKVKDKAGNIAELKINEKLTPVSKPETPPNVETPVVPEKPIIPEKPVEQPTPVYPTFEYSYNQNPVKEVDLTVITSDNNEISFQYGSFSKNKTMTITENINSFSIRVKNQNGLIKEEKINITNIIKEKTLEEQNQDIINQIYQTYGFRIDYGPKADSFWYNGSACNVLNDHKKANEALKEVNSALMAFKKDFFRNFIGENGYRVTLFDNVQGADGVASSEFGDDNRIVINANATFVGRVFYHETWHIMENCINQKSYSKPDPFANWTSQNPIGFTYTDTSSINYTTMDLDKYATEKENVDFITPYAKKNEREDRAELFTDLMFRVSKKDYMASGFGVNKKAKELSIIIRNFFPNSVGARWEKWISW